MITIPQNILETAQHSGIRAPAVRDWLLSQLQQAGISRDASPADWPQDLWDAFAALRNAAEPGSVGGGSAAGLFKNLDLPENS